VVILFGFVTATAPTVEEGVDRRLRAHACATFGAITVFPEPVPELRTVTSFASRDSKSLAAPSVYIRKDGHPVFRASSACSALSRGRPLKGFGRAPEASSRSSLGEEAFAARDFLRGGVELALLALLAALGALADMPGVVAALGVALLSLDPGALARGIGV
jgi:hypothetical protein